MGTQGRDAAGHDEVRQLVRRQEMQVAAAAQYLAFKKAADEAAIEAASCAVMAERARQELVETALLVAESYKEHGMRMTLALSIVEGGK
jgi:hypothetical protein